MESGPARCFDTLRRRLEGEEEKKGEGLREFIRVLPTPGGPPCQAPSGSREGPPDYAHSRDAILAYLFLTSRGETRRLCSMGVNTFRLIKVREPDLSVYRNHATFPGVHNDGKGQIHGAVGALLKN